MPSISCPAERTVRAAQLCADPRGCGEQRPANNPLQCGQDRSVLGLRRHEWKRKYKVQVLHEAPKNMSQSIMVPGSSPECLICSRPAFEGCTALHIIITIHGIYFRTSHAAQ